MFGSVCANCMCISWDDIPECRHEMGDKLLWKAVMAVFANS